MIKFVYFDVGGVVILDFSGNDKWEQLKREVGIQKSQDIEFDRFWDRCEPEVNAGRDVEALVPLMKEQFGSKFPPGYSLLVDGFVNRFEINKYIWPVIDKIHKVCGVGLLTNMYPHMLDAIKKKNLLPKVNWNVVIDSSVEGIIKPDFSIFELGERKAGFRGNEILFVENNKEQASVAKKFGWQVFIYDSKNPKESSSRLAALF